MLVAVLRMGAAGAAIATVGAQAISVCLSLLILRRRELSFTLRRQDIRVDKGIFLSITRFGLPLALQGLLIGFSFLAILMIVNSISVITSAGLGVANRIIAFIMVVPSAFGQAMAAFVAQNAGARKFDRATKALRYGITVSLACGVVMCLIALFLGGFLAGLFTRDPEVVINAHSYLKAYAIDCMLTPFLFCFIGFFNGLGYTKFTMAQGIIGAFCVRVPASYFLSKVVPVTLFKIGLATPMSTSLQIILCFGFLYYVKTRKWTAEDAGI